MVKTKTRLYQINYQLAAGLKPRPKLEEVADSCVYLARNITENQVKQQVIEPRQVFCEKKNLDNAQIGTF